MTKVRKAISLFLVIVLIVSSFPSGVAIADNAPVIKVAETMAMPGQTVDVDVVISGNPGILGMTLKLEFDEEYMSLVKIVGGEGRYICPQKSRVQQHKLTA